MPELASAERIILAIDTSKEAEAERLVHVAQQAGARFVKLGLELSSATSWGYCSDLAQSFGLDWVADAKLDDIPNTVEGAVKNIASKSHTPFGITMHANAGIKSMRLAQEAAGDVIMSGITELTSIDPAETHDTYGVFVNANYYGMSREDLVMSRAYKAAEAGIKGIVASPKEVALLKRNGTTRELFAMIPGTRSTDAETHDQANVGTPAKAIEDGADLLVIGRQITQAEDPAEAFRQLVREIS